jgi:hypothetical protein
MDVGLMMIFVSYGWDGMIDRQVRGAARTQGALSVRRGAIPREPITQRKETNHEPKL